MNQKIAIYIPSHNREELCKKLVSKLRSVNKEIPIYVVVNENQKYNIVDCNIIHPEKPGYIFAMNYIIRHAKEQGYTHIYYTDDDIMVPSNYMNLFERFKEDERLFSVSTYFGSEFWYIGKPNYGLKYTITRGVASSVLSVNKILEAGNYDTNITISGDTEMIIRCMKLGYYRAIDTNVCASKRIKQGLNTKNSGGTASTCDINIKEKESIEYFNEKYDGNLTKKYKNRYIFKWKLLVKTGIFSLLDKNKIDENEFKGLENCKGQIIKPKSLFDF